MGFFVKISNLSVWFLVITITGIYALYAMVEIATLAFIRVIPCLFFLTIAPLMGEKQTEKSNLAAKANDYTSDNIESSSDGSIVRQDSRPYEGVLPPPDGKYRH